MASRTRGNRSRSHSQKPNYVVESIDQESNDEEYTDRKRKISDDEDEVEVDEEDEEEDDDEVDDASDTDSKRRKSNTVSRSNSVSVEPSNTANSNNDTNNTISTSNTTSTQTSTNKPPVRRFRSGMYPVDEKGEPIALVNEEYLLPDDPKGDEKIDSNGDLLGDRTFKVRTFTLVDKDDRKFMLSTEPARAVGLRDSYMFFQTHPNLYKFQLSQGQKNDLIRRNIIPYSYRNRPISLVTARSVFKEFGYQIIENGMEGTDDYYSDPNLKNDNYGDATASKSHKDSSHKVHGKRRNIHPHHNLSHSNNNNNNANTSTGSNISRTNSNINNNSHSRNTERNKFMSTAIINDTISPARNTVEFFDRRNAHAHTMTSELLGPQGIQINATNWLYQHAAACSRFNSDMYYDRVRVLLIENQGIRDPFTNTLHIPQSTQPTRVLQFGKLQDSETDECGPNTIVYETVIHDDNLLRPNTGLSAVDPSMYEGLVDPDTLQAIQDQVLFEKGT